MTENELASIVVDCCFHIHKSLGPGLFESVYEEVLSYELAKRGLIVKRQIEVPVQWDDLYMGIGFRADIIVESKLIIELKSVESLQPVHFKQLKTYLQLTDVRVGLLINFNEMLLKDGFHRVINGF